MDLGVNGMIKLRYICLQEVGCADIDWVKLAYDRGKLADTCECSNVPSDSIKCWEILEKLKTGQLLKKDCVPFNK